MVNELLAKELAGVIGQIIKQIEPTIDYSISDKDRRMALSQLAADIGYELCEDGLTIEQVAIFRAIIDQSWEHHWRCLGMKKKDQARKEVGS